MTPSEKERLPLKIEKLYMEIGEIAMKDICRRIKKAGEITSTADWQINRLIGMGATTAEIESEIKKRLNLSYSEVFELYDKVIDWEYVRNKDLYEQVNANFVPYDQNEELVQITKAAIKQTNGDLENISKSLGYSVKINGKAVFTPLSEYYQKYVDTACMEIITGVTDYNTVLRKVVTQMANSGMRSGGITYASGHSDRIEVAARRAVMTGVSQLVGQISRMNAEKLGTDKYEVEWHAGARPSHQSWQGRVYTSTELVSICGLGTGEGLNGWNCYHTYFPFIEGVSKRQWSDEELERLNDAENTPKQWKGKEYTTYELTQEQRKMEREMRAQRELIQGLKDGHANPGDIIIAQAKYKGKMSQYKYFCDKFGFKTQMERVYVDMRGRQAALSGAFMDKNNTAVKAHYDWMKGIGAEKSVLNQLDKYYANKYTDSKEYQLFVGYQRAVSNGDINVLTTFDVYKQIDKEIQDKLIGITTSSGVKIESCANHFVDRVIGQSSNDHDGKRRGTSIEDILDALENPDSKVSEPEVRNGDIRQSFANERARVTISISDKRLIQANPLKGKE